MSTEGLNKLLPLKSDQVGTSGSSSMPDVEAMARSLCSALLRRMPADLDDSFEEDAPESTEPIPGQLTLVDPGYTKSFARKIVTETSSGSSDVPSMILEIGGGDVPRPYDEKLLQDKRIIIGNMDRHPEWGDRRLICDLNLLTEGFDSPEMAEILENARLSRIMMSQVLKFVEPTQFQKILRTSMKRMQPGGKFSVIDMPLTRENVIETRMQLRQLNVFQSDSIMEILENTLMAFASMENLAIQNPREYKLHKYLIGPALPFPVAKRVMAEPNLTKEEIQKYSEVIAAAPVRNFNITDAQEVNSKFVLPPYVEAFLELEKIDQEKSAINRRENNQRKRAEQQRKKRLRKDKKRSKR